MIKVSMRGAAEVALAAPSRKSTALRKYKQTDSGEARGRSNYYIWALTFIRQFHREGNPAGLLASFLGDLQNRIAEKPKDTRWKAKILNNMRAAEQYSLHFGPRKFTIRPGKKLAYAHGNVLVSARPDLVVEENGKILLIKLNLSKKPHSDLMADIQLHLMHAAATAVGLDLTSKQVAYIQPVRGSEQRGPSKGFPPVTRLSQICEDLENIWNS
jgi:hypothetical protein